MENITFGTYTKPEPVNPWNDVIRQMIENGPETSVTYTDNGDTSRPLIRMAANMHNRTAKFVGDETVTVKGKPQRNVTFILVGKRGRKYAK